MTTRSRHVPAGLQRKLIKTIAHGDFTAATSNSFQNGNQLPAGAIPHSWEIVFVEKFVNEDTDLLMNVTSIEGAIPQANSINLMFFDAGETLKLSAIPSEETPWAQEGERAEMTIVPDDEVTLLNTTTAGQLQVWGFYELTQVPDQVVPYPVSATLAENGKDVVVTWSEQHLHNVGTPFFQLRMDDIDYWRTASVSHDMDAGQTTVRFGEQQLDGSIGPWTLEHFPDESGGSIRGHFEDDGGNKVAQFNAGTALTIATEYEDEDVPEVTGARFTGSALDQLILITDERLDRTSIPDNAEVTFGGMAGNPNTTSISIGFGDYEEADGTTYINAADIGLSAALQEGDTEPTISFTHDSGDPFQDLVGNALPDFSEQPIQIPANAMYAYGASTFVTAYFAVNMKVTGDYTSALSAFSLKKLDGTPAAATLTAITGWDSEANYLLFTTDVEVDWGNVRIHYTQPTTKRLTDILGRQLPSSSAIVYED